MGSTFDYTQAERWNRDITEGHYQKFYIETPVEDAIITVGAEAAEVVPVAIQVADPAGDPIGREMVITIRICSNATCLTVAAIANTTVAVTTGTVLKTVTANAELIVITDETGLVELTITDSVDATKTGYIATLLPNGTYVVAEDAIEFVDNTP